MNKVDISVGQLVDMIARGELRLPELQRRYVWPAPRVRDFFDSLYRGYPSGTILVWETEQDVPERDLAVPQARSPFATHKLLLDGQQRLTSLSALLRGKPIERRGKKKAIEIAFNVQHPEGPPTDVSEIEYDEVPEPEEDGEPEEEAAAPSIQERIRSLTFVVSSKTVLRDPRWIPVTDIFSADKTDYQLLKPLGLTPEDRDWSRFSERLQRVRKIRDYPYVMYVLERERSYEEVAEIFVRVNSLGMKLRGSDLALAQITARWPGSLDFFEDLAEELEDAGFDFDLGLVIRTLIAFATKQSRFRSVGRLEQDELRAAWEKATEGLRFAVNFLKGNAGIENESLLSSPLLVIPIAVAAVERKLRLTADEERQLLHWLFAANALSHYSASTETTLDRDLRVVFDGSHPSALVELLRQQHVRLRFEPADFTGRGERSPLLALSYLALKARGAKDWTTGLSLSLVHAGRYHALQAHHVFPRSLLSKRGYEKAEVNEVANLAFLGGGPNRAFGAKPPEQYLPGVLDKRGPDALRAHCIPLDPTLWQVDNYRRFLEARRAALCAAVNEFLEGVAGERPAAALDIEALIAAGEGPTVEFKENTKYEPLVAKEVSGFMNAQGGTLLIGVDDGGTPRGLGAELERLGAKRTVDGYEQHLRSVLSAAIGAARSAEVAITFPVVDGVQVCAVRVPASSEPVFVRENVRKVFYVRNGNTTPSLDAEEANAYIRRHFERR